MTKRRRKRRTKKKLNDSGRQWGRIPDRTRSMESLVLNYSWFESSSLGYSGTSALRRELNHSLAASLSGTLLCAAAASLDAPEAVG